MLWCDKFVTSMGALSQMTRHSVARFVPALVSAFFLTTSSLAFAAGAAAVIGQSPTPKSPPQNVMPTDKSGENLLAHRASYDLSLAKVSQSDGVRAASGTMSYTLTDRCDGYTIETNLEMDLSFANGAENKVEQRYAAWEAKDGKSSTFRFQVLENGAITKAYQGDIQFKDDGTGTATYDGDKITKFDLPKGTLLSTAHTLALIKSAGAHERFLSKMVIDGSFDEGPFWVAAAIAPAHDGKISPAKGGPVSLTEGRYWPIGLAYFPAASLQATPEYEIKQNLLVTGVTHSLAQDFGGFTLAFKPVNVEPVAGPPCS